MSSRNYLFLIVLTSMLLILLFSGVALCGELPSDVARALGVTEDIGERLVTLYEYKPSEQDKARPEEEYTRIITKVSHGHGGGDVHIWRVEFVEGYSISKHLVRFYVDIDNDMSTGRQHKRSDGTPADWQGVDEMLTLDNTKDEWKMSRKYYLASGKDVETGENVPFFVAEGNVVYCRYDIPTYKEGGEFVFRARAVSQIPGKVVNSSPWLNVRAKDRGEFKGAKLPQK